ncbi:Spc98 family-domain-containing protein [Pelagophyceae sp. CCMP2097]|nr:Spc98 family-domain-containing protein [Pelagophyceae sp. CCMP2097]
MEATRLIERLAASVLECDAAPRPVVSLCARLLGSSIGSVHAPGSATAQQKLDGAGLGRNDRLRFEELRVSLRDADRGGDALIALLLELRRTAARGGATGGAQFLPRSVSAPLHAMTLDDTPQTAERVVASNVPAAAALKPRLAVPGTRHRKLARFHEEELLVRDVLYIFQGIDGRYVRLEPRSQTYVVDRGLAAKLSTLDQVRELCEVGWIFRRVRKAAQAPQVHGRVDAAFRAVLFDELTDFYRILAVLEAQLNQTVAQRQRSPAFDEQAHALTLRRLEAWADEPAQRLELLANLADAVGPRQLRGGALLSVVFAHARHGDAGAAALVRSVVQRAAVPMFSTMRRWLEHGELDDAWGEFFVSDTSLEAVAQNSRDGTAQLAPPGFDGASGAAPASGARFAWTRRYRLRPQMRPSFVDEACCDRIVVIGKAINFLKAWCGEAHVSLSHLSDDRAFTTLHGAASADALRSVVGRMAAETSRRILRSMLDTFQLKAHLGALKACVLLAQGDFVVCMVDTLASKLNAPASNIYRHDVSGAFDAAVRASNAANLAPATLDCLRVAVDVRPPPGASGWDVLAIDYDAAPPIDAVIGPEALLKYRAANKALWRHKRLEWLTLRCWRLLISTARFRTPNDAKDVRRTLHAAALARTRISHFVSALSAHYASVIDDAWRTLDAALDHADGLDGIISAHDSYLGAIFANAAFDDRRLEAQLNDIVAHVGRFAALLEAYIADSYALSPASPRALHDAARDFERCARDFDALLADAAADNAALQRLHFRLNF